MNILAGWISVLGLNGSSTNGSCRPADGTLELVNCNENLSDEIRTSCFELVAARLEQVLDLCSIDIFSRPSIDPFLLWRHWRLALGLCRRCGLRSVRAAGRAIRWGVLAPQLLKEWHIDLRESNGISNTKQKNRKLRDNEG